jgi:NhaA family Na+:H+ antiporter
MIDDRHPTWAVSDRWVPRRFVRPFVRFTRIEAASGIVLLIAAVAALIWANSRWSGAYFDVLEEHLTFEFFGVELDESLQHLINDGLMAIFFFVVGLEIKRELVMGDLRDPKAAALPVIAALGGMVAPALIYVLLNAGATDQAIRGWGIPMATDIAFAVGIVALLGSRVPVAAKLFLLALAIADDIGAIAVIAIFYTEDLDLPSLGAAFAGLAVIWAARRVRIRSLVFYLPMALVIWYFTLESGVHATLAGVALGFLTPARPFYNARDFDERARSILDQYPLEPESIRAQEHADHEAMLLSEVSLEAVSPLNRMEQRLQVWSSFLIVPLFALANAGVDFRGTSFGEAATSTVALGVSLGLILGKTVGVSLFTFGAVRLGLGRLPAGTTWRHIIGLSAVAGIGFTVSLFIAGLAFTDPHIVDLSKVGIFIGSAVSGVIGASILLGARAKSPV